MLQDVGDRHQRMKGRRTPASREGAKRDGGMGESRGQDRKVRPRDGDRIEAGVQKTRGWSKSRDRGRNAGPGNTGELGLKTQSGTREWGENQGRGRGPGGVERDPGAWRESGGLGSVLRPGTETRDWWRAEAGVHSGTGEWGGRTELRGAKPDRGRALW